MLAISGKHGTRVCAGEEDPRGFSNVQRAASKELIGRELASGPRYGLELLPPA